MAARAEECLPATPEAHLTKIPVVIDLVPGGRSAHWLAVGAGMMERGNLDGTDGDLSSRSKLTQYITGTAATNARYVQLVLPSSRAAGVRIVDVPGTYGHSPGPWTRIPHILIQGADGIIVPVDLRYLHHKEVEHDLRQAVKLRRARPLAVAVHAAPRLVSDENFQKDVREMIWPLLSRARAHEMGKVPSVETAVVLRVARSARGLPDDIERLWNWMLAVNPGTAGAPSYEDLVRAAENAKGGYRNASRSLPLTLSLLRAWQSTQPEERANDS